MKSEPTDTVKLKSFTEDESELLFLLVDKNRSYLREWLPWLDYNKSAQDSLAFIKSAAAEAAKGTGFSFGVWFQDQLAGVASLQGISRANRSASIGYWIGAEFAGHKLAQKASSALIDYGFTELGLNRIEIRCATENKRSQRVPETLGFTYEGIYRECEWLYDRFVDHRVYSLLLGEWQTAEAMK